MYKFVKPAVRMLCATGIALVLPAVANAAAIVGLFNSGVDNSGAALVGGNGVADPHYKIVQTSDPLATVGNYGVTYNYPYTTVPETAFSRWISTTATGGGTGFTTFELRFDLTGYDASTAIITGAAAADNFVDVYLNGQHMGPQIVGFTQLTPFTISSNFVSGINTLRFQLLDTGAPGALRVDQLRGTADLANANAVPEPATWAMAILGMGIIGSMARRRRAVRSQRARRGFTTLDGQERRRLTPSQIWLR